uniref:Hyaluronidase n=1 Tax=Sinocyclocheilus anshuiensis TaxID=1608454 RepID=A0A671SJ40_9TELE
MLNALRSRCCRSNVSPFPGMDGLGHGSCPLVVFVICFASVLGRPSSLLTHLLFFSMWNTPTEQCTSRYGIELDLSVFDIGHNCDQAFMGDNITIFYSDKLGEYPYYGIDGEPVYGGVPQNASLDRHLWKADNDLRTDIPDLGFHELAVIDWDKWKPLWERNWDAKEIYWNGSRALVKAKHPTRKPDQIEKEAVREFEDAICKDSLKNPLYSLLLERPGGFCGFYVFPCCYNYQYKKNEMYTGECPALEMKRNDKLVWLWNVSSALFKICNLTKMVCVTHRCFQEDFVHTIGESVALGAASVVLWGDGNYSQTKKACVAVRDYLDDTLGRYIVNVTEAAFLCSQAVCLSKGRCIRRDPSGMAYLHLDPAEWSIVPRTKLPGSVSRGPSYVAHRRFRMVEGETSGFTASFRCQCFPGWEGEQCQKPVPVEPFT